MENHNKTLTDIYKRILSEIEITSTLNKDLDLIIESLPEIKRDRLLAFKTAHHYGLIFKLINEIYSELKFLDFDVIIDSDIIRDEAQKRMQDIIDMNYNAMPSSEKSAIDLKLKSLDRISEKLKNKYT